MRHRACTNGHGRAASYLRANKDSERRAHGFMPGRMDITILFCNFAASSPGFRNPNPACSPENHGFRPRKREKRAVWTRSSMDRISDSGSDDRSSNLLGFTKAASGMAASPMPPQVSSRKSHAGIPPRGFFLTHGRLPEKIVFSRKSFRP